jgi:hypothetical protein
MGYEEAKKRGERAGVRGSKFQGVRRIAWPLARFAREGKQRSTRAATTDEHRLKRMRQGGREARKQGGKEARKRKGRGGGKADSSSQFRRRASQHRKASPLKR